MAQASLTARLITGLLDGPQSVLAPAGPDAVLIAEISWVLFAGGAIVFVVVMAIAAYAIGARRERAADLSSRALVVGGGIVFPTVVLTALLGYSLWRSTALAVAGGAPLRIEVTGEQWWWRVHYLDAEGRVDFATANEIRIPVGTPVDLTLRSADVIHSFWVPALAGKLDMIPGRVTSMRISADRTGTYRGQCAEYCGGPHGFMALAVVAEAQPDFATWAQAQRAPARRTTGQAGAIAILESACSACHTVRGTRAAGTRGPDLTHLASRRALGAERLPMGAASIAAWITSNQHLKPGNLMPEFRNFTEPELRALVAYLEALR